LEIGLLSNVGYFGRDWSCDIVEAGHVIS